MALMIVHFADSAPVKFRSDHSGPFWNQVIDWLETKHGPGTLQDEEGFELLYNSSTDDVLAPPGEYRWTKAAGETPRCHSSAACDRMKVNRMSAGSHCHKIVLPREPSLLPAEA